jgi:hypothetical protein
MKLLKWYSVLVTVLFLIACGGGNQGSSNNGQPGGGSTSTTSHSVGAFSGLPGMHAVRKITTTVTSAFNFDIIPTAHAQVATPLVASGTLTGFCNSSPDPVIFANVLNQPVELITYGMGRFDSAENCAVPQGNWAIQAGKADVALPSMDGAPVFDAGTIFRLNVQISAASKLSSATSGKVNVYVLRGGQVSTLTLTCTLGTTTDCNDNGNTSGHTFALLPRDQVFATVLLGPGEQVKGFRVALSIA